MRKLLDAVDHERARAQGNLFGDPVIASPNSNYPVGTIVDRLCLACGNCFAAHDEDNDCWRILKSVAQLAEYDAAQKVCDRIKGDVNQTTGSFVFDQTFGVKK